MDGRLALTRKGVQTDVSLLLTEPVDGRVIQLGEWLVGEKNGTIMARSIEIRPINSIRRLFDPIFFCPSPIGKFVVNKKGQSSPPQMVMDPDGSVWFTTTTVNPFAPDDWPHKEGEKPNQVLRFGNYLFGPKDSNHL